MNKRKILGLILMAPVVLTVLFCIGLFIYSYFVFYPVAMCAVTAIGMFMFGVNLLSSETPENPPTNAEGKHDESR